ncbi:unnamed protein product [Symbiodinium sp. CCMP2592]|nr:unnamed protein product [Symbiodinium sp. CCMP2592]
MKKPAATVKAVGKVAKALLKKPATKPGQNLKPGKKVEEEVVDKETKHDKQPEKKNKKQSTKEQPSKKDEKKKNDKEKKNEKQPKKKNDKEKNDEHEDDEHENDEHENDEEQEDDEEGQEVDPGEMALVPVQKQPLSLKNIKTHAELLEVKGWSGKDVWNAFKMLPSGEQQMVWKLFEKGRQKEGCDASYRDQTAGAGGNKRKQDMLTSWLLDEGKCGDYYQKACLQLTKMSSRQLKVSWEPWKAMTNRYGKTEALARLKAGTMKWRRSKTDSNFLEFANVVDKEAEGFVKQKSCSVEGPDKKVKKERAAALDKLTFDELEDMEMVKGMKIDADLKSVITRNAGGVSEDSSSSEKDDSSDSSDKKKSKKKKSKVDDTDNKSEFNKKLTLFKSELQKEETFFQMLLLESKLKKDERKNVQQNLDDLTKTLKQVGASIDKIGSKEAVKKSLLMALTTLKASKTLKKNLAGKKTQTQDEKLKRKKGETSEES